MERRDLGGGRVVLISSALLEMGVLAVFTERTGGVSEGPYASLNLSYSTGDDPRRVAANRRALVEGLGIPPFALGGQVHAADIATVGPERAGSGYDGPDGVIPRTDGLTTCLPGISLAVVTADCVPIVLADESRIAVLHAGWRGVAAGIVERGLGLFERPQEVRAAIGPAAGGCHYEVDEQTVGAVAAGRRAISRREADRWFLDLPATVAAVLSEGGVRSIEVSGICTIHERRRFFSHRRDGPCGRQVAIAVRA